MIDSVMIITKRDQTVINIINLMDSNITNTLTISYNIIVFAAIIKKFWKSFIINIINTCYITQDLIYRKMT